MFGQGQTAAITQIDTSLFDLILLFFYSLSFFGFLVFWLFIVSAPPLPLSRSGAALLLEMFRLFTDVRSFYLILILFLLKFFFLSRPIFERFDDGRRWPRRRQRDDDLPAHIENQSVSPLCVCARGFDLVKTYKDDPQ